MSAPLYSPILRVNSSDINITTNNTPLLASTILHNYENNSDNSFIPLTSIDIVAAFRQLQSKAKKLEIDGYESKMINENLKSQIISLHESYKHSLDNMIDTDKESITKLENMKKEVEQDCHHLRLKLAALETNSYCSINNNEQAEVLINLEISYGADASFTSNEINNTSNADNNVRNISNNNLKIESEDKITESNDDILLKRRNILRNQISEWKTMISTKEYMISFTQNEINTIKQQVGAQIQSCIKNSSPRNDETSTNTFPHHQHQKTHVYFLNRDYSDDDENAKETDASSHNLEMQINLKMQQIADATESVTRTSVKIQLLERYMEVLIAANNKLLDTLTKRRNRIARQQNDIKRQQSPNAIKRQLTHHNRNKNNNNNNDHNNNHHISSPHRTNRSPRKNDFTNSPGMVSDTRKSTQRSTRTQGNLRSHRNDHINNDASMFDDASTFDYYPSPSPRRNTCKSGSKKLSRSDHTRSRESYGSDFDDVDVYRRRRRQQAMNNGKESAINSPNRSRRLTIRSPLKQQRRQSKKKSPSTTIRNSPRNSETSNREQTKNTPRHDDYSAYPHLLKSIYRIIMKPESRSRSRTSSSKSSCKSFSGSESENCNDDSSLYTTENLDEDIHNNERHTGIDVLPWAFLPTSHNLEAKEFNAIAMQSIRRRQEILAPEDTEIKTVAY